MAQKLFKGFRQELEGQFTAETGYLYFVRNEANTGKTDGYLLFNGKKYGTSAEAVEYLEALIGELPSGFSSVSEWVESNERVTAAALTDLDARVSANTEAIEAISGVTGDFATKTELGALSGRVDTLEAVSADTRLDTLEAVSAETRISAIEADYLKAADKTELEGEIGTLSGRVDTLEAVSADTRLDALEAVSADSRISAIEADYLKAADKTELEGEIGTLSGRVDTLEAISADTRLNALEEGVQVVVSGDSSVNVTEISGGTQEVSVKISQASDNALELNNDGLFAAIYYDGNDSDNE